MMADNLDSFESRSTSGLRRYIRQISSDLIQIKVTTEQKKLHESTLITTFIKLLQHFKIVLVSLYGNRFHETVKGISFNYFKTVSSGINSVL